MIVQRRDRAFHVVTALAAVWLGGVGVVHGTWAVGGSDSSCYALMADAFAGGQLQPSSALASEAPWPAAALTLAPAGFQPSPVRPEAASPICAPGFSLLLAPVRWLGGRDAIFLVTPLAGVVLVWLVFAFSNALGGAAAGALAALLVATSPIVLFQVVQPMNDLTTAALWMAVLVSALAPGARAPLGIGAVTGLAILVRPNLAPAALVVGGWVLARALSAGLTSRPPSPACFAGRDFRPVEAQSSRSGIRPAVPPLLFAVGLAPSLVAIGLLNAGLYGSPFASGYGDLGSLFGPGYLSINVVNYGRALLDTQTPLPLLALAAPFTCARPRRPHCWLALTIATAVTIGYLFYRPFPEWWYVRFLMPALVMALALASVVIVRLLGGLSESRALVAGAALATALSVLGIRSASARQAFALADLEARYRLASAVVRDRLPRSTVVLAVFESGSVRYHAGREAVLWDSLDPGWLDRTVQWLEANGRSPVILVERWEEPLFRNRFGDRARLGGLDWAPRFDIDRRVRIFDPADRPRYFAGELVLTEYVRR